MKHSIKQINWVILLFLVCFYIFQWNILFDSISFIKSFYSLFPVLYQAIFVHLWLVLLFINSFYSLTVFIRAKIIIFSLMLWRWNAKILLQSLESSTSVHRESSFITESVSFRSFQVRRLPHIWNIYIE